MVVWRRVSGNMDQNLRNPTCLILSHTHVGVFVLFELAPTHKHTHTQTKGNSKLSSLWRNQQETVIRTFEQHVYGHLSISFKLRRSTTVLDQFLHVKAQSLEAMSLEACHLCSSNSQPLINPTKA